MKNREFFFAIGFKNLYYCFSFCVIFNKKIHEIGYRKKGKRFFFLKTRNPEMYKFLTMPENKYLDDYYFLSILRPKKDNEK